MTHPPLSAHAHDALAAALAEHYPEEVLRALGQDTVDPHVIARRLLDPEHLHNLLAHSEAARGALLIAAEAPSTRGDQLRREGILRGLGDLEPGMRHLLEAGLLVLVPAPGAREWELADELDTRRYLQRPLTLPPPLADALRPLLLDAAAQPPAHRASEPEVRPLPAASLLDLELNLLHFASRLGDHTLTLNKDGTPNRRSLARFTRGLRLPGLPAPAADDLDLNDARVFERVHLLLALAAGLGFLRVDEPRRLAILDPDAARAFFTAAEAERDRALLRALRGAEVLDEIAAASFGLGLRSNTSPDPRRTSLLATPATLRLKGPRGQLLSDLKRLPLDRWTSLGHIVDLLLALDRGYLGATLAATPDAPAYAPDHFARAALISVLPWMGLLELATEPDYDDVPRFARWTPRGLRLLAATPPPEPPPQGPCLTVQPNLEGTVYLQAASLAILQRLYEVGERTSLTNHTATFRFTAESVQRGYGRGASADGLLAFLNRHSHTPVPDGVAFVLRDWERVQQRITLYDGGTLLEHPDPDHLDLILGTLRHYLTDERAPIPLGATEVYLPDVEDSILTRAFDLHQAHRIDYTEAPPPCLAADPDDADLLLRPLPCGLDIITHAELERFAQPLGDPWEPSAWRLDLDRVRVRWPQDPARHLLDFLDLRMDDGVPPDLELLLLSRIRGDVHATLHEDAIVITLSSPEVCDTLLDIPDVEDHTLQRLGPAALLVDPEGRDLIQQILGRLGLLTPRGS